MFWVLVFLLTACAPIPTLAPAPAATSIPALLPTPIPTGTTRPTTELEVMYTPTPQPLVDSPAWAQDAVLYEVFVRSFYDSDGDGIGDIAGLTANLDYLEQLGAGAIWLMPIHPSPSYHGYDVVDYFAVNPDYGTQGDMIALVDAAHERGIRVIMDFVVNHVSKEHPFFQDALGNPGSKYSDWFLWTNEDHTSYEAFGGFEHMPKLNHGNPDVVAYVVQIARFWMDLDGDGDYTDGVDGFRADVAKEVPLTTWQALRREGRKLNPDLFLLGEAWDGNAQHLVKWYDDAFDALFDFPLYHTLAGDQDQSEDSVLAGEKEPDFLNAIIIGEDKLFPSGYQVVRFVNNHDTNRVMSDVGEEWARAHTAATLNLTLPGMPMIYYGEAFGMRGEKGRGTPYWDEYRREPMDWYAAEEGEGMTTWFKPPDRYNAPHDQISVEEQASLSGTLLGHYRALTRVRNDHPALQTGAFGRVQVSEADGVYALSLIHISEPTRL